jgi:hypothetical protein
MKRLLLSTLFTLFAVAAFAQKGTVTGTVVDAETGETVAGAVLEFSPAGAPDKKQYSTSGFKGAVSIPSLAYGEYKLVVSFLGYNSAETTFKVSAAKQDIGKIELRPGVQIETVVKEAKALRTSQKGDTVSYNAGAFKVTDDADVEGLLKKMPGITVSDGTVEAQGESVKKIFVDGKEFFGEDVTTAIKTRPNFRAWTTARVIRRSTSSPMPTCGRDSSVNCMPVTVTMPIPRLRPKTNMS